MGTRPNKSVRSSSYPWGKCSNKSVSKLIVFHPSLSEKIKRVKHLIHRILSHHSLSLSLKSITRSLTLHTLSQIHHSLSLSLSLIQFKHSKLYIALLSNSLKINEWLLGISIIKEWGLVVRILGRRILLKKFSRKRTQRDFLSGHTLSVGLGK